MTDAIIPVRRHRPMHVTTITPEPSAPSRQEPPKAREIAPEPPTALEEAGLAADRLLHAWQGQLTAGLSPAALFQAFSDWAIHLSNAPGKRADLVRKWFRKALRLAYWSLRAPTNPETPYAIEPLPNDRRFRAPEWHSYPAAALWQTFLMYQQWWHNATSGVRGVAPQHEEIVRFTMRQILDAVAPSNFLWTNPEVVRATVMSGGLNLQRGFQNFLEDVEAAMLGRRPHGADRFVVGRDVGVTPGKVVFRNRLIELIQYEPTTPTVHPEPVLIVPAWIMKYYILDLSPSNSLVKYLVDRGHTVFIISWKNPSAEERDFSLDDYLSVGVLRALEAVRAIVPDRKVHAVGYCLGGTLLSMAAAVLARDRRDELKTVTLLAAQTDFTEAGELMLFINDSQVAYLEDIMWDRGYLDTRQMSGAFQLLRSNDLIWSTIIRQYLMGERMAMTDLMAWNADATRMPFRMHSEYLRKLFLNNDLAAGRYRLSENCCNGGVISLDDIHVPIIAVSTTKDHIAPWKSVYKISWLANADTMFILATGGHNAGIVSPPGIDGREFHMAEKLRRDPALDPETWYERATRHEGSWWPAWAEYIARHSTTPRASARPAGSPERGYPPLADAPGMYVLQP